jgi:adenylylsulfate kinase-like enzyme
MIYVLYGQPGSGKTTLGSMLARELDTPFFIDGDVFRKMFSQQVLGYGRDGRSKNIRNVNAVATFLNKKGKSEDWMCIYVRDKNKPNSIEGISVNNETDIVLSFVNPYEELREELKMNNEGQVVQIYLKTNRELRKEYHVDDFEIGEPDICLDTDQDVSVTFRSIKSYIDKANGCQ